MSEETFVYTACPGWGDHDFCVLKTIVEDGKIVRTEKADYSGPEFCDGHICQKGLIAGRQPYHPDRLLKPLKRAGERGEGKWEEISWDQALEEISHKMLELKEKYGPESIVTWSLAAGVPPSFGMNQVLGARFASLWGMTDPIYSLGLDNGPFYTNFYNFGSGAGFMITDPQNFIDANYIIVWGANPIENQMRITQNLVRARENGARIVDIGLIFDGTAGWSDEFVGVKPGSDGYLALAMGNHIISNDLHDKEFLKEHTVACYLIRDDDGQYLRDAASNYLVWDDAIGAPCAVASAGGTIDAQEPALLGSFEVDGVSVKTAFQLLKDHLAGFTLEDAEKISGVDPATIARISTELAEAPNAYVLGALGLRYVNQGETYRSFQLLAVLTGNLGRPGAGVTVELIPTCYPVLFNDLPITRPFPEDNKINVVRLPQFFENAKLDDCPYKALIVPMGNPIHQIPSRGRWLDFIDKLELIVDYDIWMTDTGEMADYVLPDCMPFERLEVVSFAQYNHIVLQEPAIEPQGEAKPPHYFWSELAKRVGLGEYFDKTEEEWIAMRLETDYPPIASLEPKLTYERLKAEKMVRQNAPESPKFDPFAALQFPTATGRIEFYFDRLADLGFALPQYVPCFESPVIDGNERFPYQFFTGRQRFFMQSMFTDDPICIDLSGGKPATRMNPADALAEGLKDGDKVEVYNDRGHVVSVLHTDEAVPPGTVHVWFGWRRRQFEEGTYAELISPLSGIETIDKVADRWWDDLVATGAPVDSCMNGDIQLTGAWDTMWDCACAVRPYTAGKEA